MPKILRNKPDFQSHAGSIEADIVLEANAKRKLFQSHAGSIEARRGGGRLYRRRRLSIPRWFD